MVYLNRIYTKSGDHGETSLGDGSRVPKTHPRIVAYGTVDELNSVIGVVLNQPPSGQVAEWLRSVQNDLFDVGADLCVPDAPSSGNQPEPLRVTRRQVERLEVWIDTINERLEPLTSFILPGGTPAAAFLHLARTVCRRAEIAARALADAEPVTEHVHAYLNRLSDLLFVLARAGNDNGRQDILWVPGQGDTE